MNRVQFLLTSAAAATLAAAAPAFAAEAAPPAGYGAGASGASSGIVRSATDLPGPLAQRGPAMVKVNLETTEVTGQLADGSTYRYWTFNGKVPGRSSVCGSATRSR